MEPSTVRSLVLAYLFVALLALVFVIGFIAPASAFPINGGYICLDTTPRCLVCDFDCGMATAKSSCDSFGFASDAAQVVADASLYDWCVSSPPLIINGACGSADGSNPSSAPTSGLCASGTASAVSNSAVNNAWSWTCSGSGGGTTASCQTAVNTACHQDFEVKICNPNCDTYSNSCGPGYGTVKIFFGSQPPSDPCRKCVSNPAVNGVCSGTAGACTAGTASGDNGSTACGTTRTWTCNGSGGGTNASCSVANPACSVNGSCGSTAGTCSSGTPGGDNNASACGTTRTWTCSGSGGGSTANCSKANAACPTPVNGTCGSANGQDLTAAPSGGDLCNAGSASTVSGTGPWSWTCAGANGGSTASCSATLCGGPPAVDAACGPAAGQYFSSASAVNSTGLCNPGTSPNVSGSGPWNWTCTGENGGANASCSAAKATTVNGACTSYGSTYASQPASNTSNGCTAGTFAEYSDTGSAWRWQCTGGGAPTGSTATCSANKASAGCVLGPIEEVSGGAYPSIKTWDGWAGEMSSPGPHNLCQGSNYVSTAYGGTGVFASLASCGSLGAGDTSPNGACLKSVSANCGNNLSCATNCSVGVHRCASGATNGVCGSANGTTVSSAPTANLCSAGTASAVSGSGPWNWTCNGSGGGSNASCSASAAPTCNLNAFGTSQCSGSRITGIMDPPWAYDQASAMSWCDAQAGATCCQQEICAYCGGSSLEVVAYTGTAQPQTYNGYVAGCTLP